MSSSKTISRGVNSFLYTWVPAQGLSILRLFRVRLFSNDSRSRDRAHLLRLHTVAAPTQGWAHMGGSRPKSTPIVCLVSNACAYSFGLSWQLALPSPQQPPGFKPRCLSFIFASQRPSAATAWGTSAQAELFTAQNAASDVAAAATV